NTMLPFTSASSSGRAMRASDGRAPRHVKPAAGRGTTIAKSSPRCTWMPVIGPAGNGPTGGALARVVPVESTTARATIPSASHLVITATPTDLVSPPGGARRIGRSPDARARMRGEGSRESEVSHAHDSSDARACGRGRRAGAARCRGCGHARAGSAADRETRDDACTGVRSRSEDGCHAAGSGLSLGRAALRADGWGDARDPAARDSSFDDDPTARSDPDRLTARELQPQRGPLRPSLPLCVRRAYEDSVARRRATPFARAALATALATAGATPRLKTLGTT